MKVEISEARLNDLAYMALKRYFFEPQGVAPRECDIRVVMDMAVPSRITSPMQAILRPDEVSGRSHTTMYEVDTDQVLSVAIEYMEDHFRGKLLDPEGVKADWATIVPVLMDVPESDCGG